MTNARSPAQTLNLTLRNFALAALILFVGCCGYLVIRLSMVVYRVEKGIVAVTVDVRKVTSTVGKLSDDVAAMRTEVHKLKDTAKQVVPVQDIRDAVREVLASAPTEKLDATKLAPVGRWLKSQLAPGQAPPPAPPASQDTPSKPE